MYFSLKVHSILDYVVAAFYLFAPFLFGFGEVVVARNLFVSMGLLMLFSSLATANYFSLAKIVPLGVHLWMDVLAGMMIYLGPFFFGYLKSITVPQYFLHVLVGIFSICHVVYTRVQEEEWRTSAMLSKRRHA